VAGTRPHKVAMTAEAGQPTGIARRAHAADGAVRPAERGGRAEGCASLIESALRQGGALQGASSTGWRSAARSSAATRRRTLGVPELLAFQNSWRSRTLGVPESSCSRISRSSGRLLRVDLQGAMFLGPKRLSSEIDWRWNAGCASLARIRTAAKEPASVPELAHAGGSYERCAARSGRPGRAWPTPCAGHDGRGRSINS